MISLVDTVEKIMSEFQAQLKFNLICVCGVGCHHVFELLIKNLLIQDRTLLACDCDTVLMDEPGVSCL